MILEDKQGAITNNFSFEKNINTFHDYIHWKTIITTFWKSLMKYIPKKEEVIWKTNNYF
jgi:hypothetical protein